MISMDFDSLRNQVLQDTSQAEESVKVNQRHLIDKLLARYCQDFTVFRELLQNSNDAQSSNAVIDFVVTESSASSWFSNAKYSVTHIIYRNNGIPFSEKDWIRLKNIAEGNPDETKIGFFGVGFYSLFSLCEDPFVTSGGDSVAFFWKGDMLYTKRSSSEKKTFTGVKDDDLSTWTSFYLELRTPIPLPEISDFSRFLAAALAFTVHLKDVKLRFKNEDPRNPSSFVDVININKTVNESSELNINYIPNDGVISKLLTGNESIINIAKEQSSGIFGKVINTWLGSQHTKEKPQAISSIEEIERVEKKEVQDNGNNNTIVDSLACVRFRKLSPNKIFEVTRVYTKLIQIRVVIQSSITIFMKTKSKSSSSHIESKTLKLCSRSKFPDIGKKPTTLSDNVIYQEMSMRCLSMDITSTLPEELGNQMIRVTKKPAPKHTTLSAIYSNYDEFTGSLCTSKGEKIVSNKSMGFLNFNYTKKESVILAPLLPDPEESVSLNDSSMNNVVVDNDSDLNMSRISDNEQGNIYIGFSTFQTTGTSLQFLAPFIPTVERESIDFVDETLKIWNKELLIMLGYLARIVYEDDMLSIRKKLVVENIDSLDLKNEASSKLNTLQKEIVDWALKRAVHCMAAFSFPKSTPANIVGDIIARGFRSGGKLLVDKDTETLIFNDLEMNNRKQNSLPSNTKLIDAVSCLSCKGIKGSNEIRILSSFDRRMLNPTQNEQHYYDSARIDTAVVESKELVPLLRNSSYFIPDIYLKTSRFVRILATHKMGFTRFGLFDLLDEFDSRALTISEFILFIRWWVTFREDVLDLDDADIMSGSSVGGFTYSKEDRAESFAVRDFVLKLLKCLVIHIPGSTTDKDRYIRVDSIRKYIKKDTIPLNPNFDKFLPDYVMPLEISSRLSQKEMQMGIIRGSWSELILSDFVQIFATKVLTFNPETVHDEFLYEDLLFFIADLRIQNKPYLLRPLLDHKFIHTQHGYFKPSETYLKSVDLFDDLPIVDFNNYLISIKKIYAQDITGDDNMNDYALNKNMLTLLKSIGVREHIDLKIIFSRLDTLNWNHIKLIKYLSTLQDKLSPSEWKNLSRAKFLRTEYDVLNDTNNNTNTPKVAYAAHELYMPDDEIRIFLNNKKLLAWVTDENKIVTLNKNSEEYKFLTNLGIKTYVKLQDFVNYLGDAMTKFLTLQENGSSTENSIGQIGLAFKYYRDNFEDHYSNQKIPSNLNIIPCVVVNADNSKQNIQFYPSSECYLDKNAALFGFPVVHPNFVKFAPEFNINERPKGAILVNSIVNNPPKDKVQANKIFSTMLNYAGNLDSYDISRLSKARIVPISQNFEGEDKITFSAPTEVFIGSPKKDVYKLAFTYTTFSDLADSFLQILGAKTEPTMPEFSEVLLQDPAKYWSLYGTEQYLEIIKNLADAVNSEGFRKYNKKIMTNARWLIGIKRVEVDDDFNNDENEFKDGLETFDSLLAEVTSSSTQFEYSLASSNEIYLLDNELFSKLFNPLGCPQDIILEQFYASLGCKWMSEAVQTKFEVVRYTLNDQNEIQKLETSRKQLEKLVRFRIPLLLHDNQNGSRKNSRREAKDDLFKLKYSAVREIRIHNTFDNKTKLQRTTAMLSPEKMAYNLYYTIDKFDFFDLGRELGKIVYKNCRLKETLFLETVLGESLEKLNRKGFPVDRLLKLQEQNKIASERKMKEEQELQEKIKKEEEEKRQKEYLEQQAILKLEREQRKKIEEQKQANIQLLDSLNEPISKGNESPISNEPPYSGSSISSEKPKRESIGSKFKSILSKGVGSGLNYESLMQNNMLNGSSSNSFKGQGTSYNNEVSPGINAGTSLMDSSRTNKHLENSIKTMNKIGNESKNSRSKDFEKSLNEIQAKFPDESSTPETKNIDSIAQSTCRPLKGADLVLFKMIGGVRLYIDKKIIESLNVDVELSLYNDDIASKFSALLKTLMYFVFGLEEIDMVNMFWDNNRSGAIAFNRSRSLFFNLSFFVTMQHHLKVISPASLDHLDSKFITSSCDVDVVVYWFMTACHELAHNFEHGHNATHEFWMSSFAEKYIPVMLKYLRT